MMKSAVRREFGPDTAKSTVTCKLVVTTFIAINQSISQSENKVVNDYNNVNRQQENRRKSAKSRAYGTAIHFFNFELPSELLCKRTAKFLHKLHARCD